MPASAGPFAPWCRVVMVFSAIAPGYVGANSSGATFMTENFQAEKTQAAAWFRQLRDDIVTAFNGLEARQPGPTLALMGKALSVEIQ